MYLEFDNVQLNVSACKISGRINFLVPKKEFKIKVIY